MAEDEVDFWSATIESYAPLELPSPQLTVKLLKRPPFRFIHDLISAINSKYNTFTHIFSPDQLDSNNVDSKEAKIAYLNTVIHHVQSVLNTKIDVSVKKIITGSEPEKTNVLLQHIANAVNVGDAGDRGARSSSATSSRKAASATRKPLSSEVSADSSASPHHNDHGLAGRASAPASTRASSKKSSRAATSTRSSSAKVKVQLKETLRSAAAFNDKVTGFAIGMDVHDTRNVAEDGRRIAQMWNELATTTVETTPSKLSASALEIAIKRQIESIKQVNELNTENDEVIQKLVDVLL